MPEVLKECGVIPVNPPFLCGGTLTTLIMRARKTRPDKFNDPSDKLSEPEVLAGLVEAITGLNWHPELRTLKKVASNYKNCLSSSTIPLEDASIASQYGADLEFNFQAAVKRMGAFALKYLDQFNASQLVKSIIEIIRDDSLISPCDFFYMNGYDHPITKHQLEVENEVSIAQFLVGVWHYVLTNRREDNTRGLSTLDYWAPKMKNRPRDYSHFPFGATILHKVSVEFPRDTAAVHENDCDNPSEFDKSPVELYLNSIKKYYSYVYTVLAPLSPIFLEDIYTSADLEPLNVSIRRQMTEPIIKHPSIWNLIALAQLIAIIGIGGIGKTIHMRYWLLECIKDYPKTGLIPFFIEPKSYRMSDESLMEYIVRSVRQHADDFTPATIRSFIKSGSCIIFFDGADEVSSSASAQFKAQLDDFIKLYPNTKIVLSARSSHYDRFPHSSRIASYQGFSYFSVQPLTLQQAKELIRRVTYWDEEEKRRFLVALDGSLYKTHEKVCGIPLLLVILLATYKSYGEIPSELHVFIRKAYDALLFLHDRMKHGYIRRMYCGLDSNDFTPYIAAFCFQAHSNSLLDFSEEKFNELMGNVLSRRNPENGATPTNFLLDASDGVCLLYEEAGEYHFLHRFFVEWLTAYHLSKKMTETGKYDSIRRYFDEEQHGWSEDTTFSMLYSMQKNELDINLFYPLFSEMLDKYGTGDYGYWHFMCEKYPFLNVQRIPYEEIDDEGTSEVQEWVFSLKPETQSTSFLYNHFIHANNLSHVEELDDYDWKDGDVALFKGAFVVRNHQKCWADRTTTSEVVLYDTTIHNPPTPDFYHPHDVLGFGFSICTRLLDDEGDPNMADVFHRMSEDDFPLRIEFNEICKWVQKMRNQLEDGGKNYSASEDLA